jgi:hypothetical protein
MIKSMINNAFKPLAISTILLVAIFTALPAAAQLGLPKQETSSDVATQSPSPNDLKEFSRLLGDPKILEWLRNSALKVQVDESDNSAGNTSFRAQFDLGMAAIGNRLSEIQAAIRMLPTAPRTIMDIWQARINNSETLRAIAFCIIFLFIGAGLEWLYWQYFTSMRLKMEFTSYNSLRQRMNSAVMRLILVGVALSFFALGSIGAFLTFTWPAVVGHVVLSLLIAIIVIRIILAAAKFMLAPKAPELRFVPLSSGPAKRLYMWTGFSAIITVFGMAITDTFAYLSNTANAPDSAKITALAISILSALTIACVLLLAVWRMSKSAGKIRPGIIQATAGRNIRATPILMTVLIVSSTILWLLGARQIMWTLIIIALIIPAIAIMSRFTNYLFDQAEGEKLNSPRNKSRLWMKIPRQANNKRLTQVTKT